MDNEIVKRLTALHRQLDKDLHILSGFLSGYEQCTVQAAKDHYGAAENAAKHATWVREQAEKIAARTGLVIYTATALEREAKAATVAAQQDRLEDEARAAEEPSYRQVPASNGAASFIGSDQARQSVGNPGHCERCVSIGHVAAHPELGCGDVGCYASHE